MEVRKAGSGTQPFPFGGSGQAALYCVQGWAVETLYYGCAEVPRTVTPQEAPVSCLLTLGRGSVHFRKSHDWFPQEGFPAQRKASGALPGVPSGAASEASVMVRFCCPL